MEDASPAHIFRKEPNGERKFDYEGSEMKVFVFMFPPDKDLPDLPLAMVYENLEDAKARAVIANRGAPLDWEEYDGSTVYAINQWGTPYTIQATPVQEAKIEERSELDRMIAKLRARQNEPMENASIASYINGGVNALEEYRRLVGW